MLRFRAPVSVHGTGPGPTVSVHGTRPGLGLGLGLDPGPGLRTRPLSTHPFSNSATLPSVIGRLRGTIEAQEADGSAVVDVSGVGYEVFLPVGTAGRAGTEPGEPVVLHVHTHVREDTITLFGFSTPEDRAAFRALLKVSSIGPKLALSILGVMDAAALRDAIARQDKTAFKGISGVGKKTVERILVDLQDKLEFAGPQQTGVRLRAVPRAPGSPGDTVVGALVQLGYKRSEAEAAVGTATSGPSGEDVEGLLRAALTALS